MALEMNNLKTVLQEMKKCPKKSGIPQVITTLDDLIRELHSAFEDDVVDTDYVQDLMLAYKSNPLEWRKFAKFDRYKYTRNLVDEGNGKFNLMLLCWGEGQQSAIHDHADAHCFMKMLDGSLNEIRYAWPQEGEQGLNVIGTSLLEKNGVCYINDSLGLHRVANPSHIDPAVSLHLYCPPFNACHMFDLRSGKKTAVNITFWSKFGDKVPLDVGTNHSCCEPVPIAK